MANIICGVDLSSKYLDACIGKDGAFERFANTPEGVEALVVFCKTHDVEMVAMEATGGYEKRLFALLWAQGVPAAIVNPWSVRRFAEGVGFLEKTDRIDAGVIAWFAQTKGTVPCEPAGADQMRLTALVTRLRQLTDQRTMLTNQKRMVSEPAVLESFAQMLVLTNQQIRSFAGEIAGLIDSDPLWKKLDETFRSIKGVADRTVARLMADLPEIGTLSNKAISKLVGLAPIAHSSGNYTGKRPIRGGRGSVRSILFIAAGLVRKWDDDFAAFSKRLSDAGKPKKVIRVALAHKLLVRLNAKAREVRENLALAA